MAMIKLCEVRGKGVLFREPLRAAQSSASIQTFRRLHEFAAAFLETGKVPDSHSDVAAVYLKQQKRQMGSVKCALTATPITAEGVALSDQEIRGLKEQLFAESYTINLKLRKIGLRIVGTCATIALGLFSLPSAKIPSIVVDFTLVTVGAFTVIGTPFLFADMVTTTWKKRLQIKLSDLLWKDHLAGNARNGVNAE